MGSVIPIKDKRRLTTNMKETIESQPQIKNVPQSTIMLMLHTVLLFAISLASLSVSGLPVPDTSSSGSTELELPHRRARLFNCEELSPSREANLRNLGSLETGLAVLQNNSSKLNDKWPLTQSPVCTSPVIHAFDREADSLSVESVNAQDIANWVGVFEAYGEVVQLIIARDIPAEQTEELKSLYDVISAVLMDYNQVLQPLYCNCTCDVDCFEVPSVLSDIPEDCPSLAALVISDLNIRELTAAKKVSSYSLINLALNDETGVSNYFSEYLAAKPLEEEWISEHSLNISNN